MLKECMGVVRLGRGAGLGVAVALAAASACSVGLAQQGQVTSVESKAKQVYLPIPGFDKTSIDSTVDPCNDFYKFSCGKFAANHPIPADQAGVDQFYALYNVNTQSLSGILDKAAAGGAGRSADEQKIGDYYKACMDLDAIEAKGLAPVQPLLDEINAVTSKKQLPALIGKLQRMGIDVFFGYGEQQDFKDASKQIAFADQAGLGMPERDYYLRTGAKDETLRKQYVEHVAKMLTLSGMAPEKATQEANSIMTFETALAKASMPVTERRDP
jgi:endothelin-converting enzyme/putative endopeptidase